MSRYAKFWTALSAGIAIFLASGLITGQPAVWISTAVSAVTAAVAVLAGPANKPRR